MSVHAEPMLYCFKCSVLLDPADEKLLEEDIQAPSSSKRYDYQTFGLV